MESVVQTRLQSVQFGEAQTYKNITILPLIAPADGTFQYRTLGEALATWDIAITARAKDFLAEICAAEERQFPSVGHGTDYRYKAKALAGSVLVHQNEVIHAAFFRLDEPEQAAYLTPRRTARSAS